MQRDFLKNLLRPGRLSWWIRGLWLAVALLHGWLALRHLAADTGIAAMDLLRSVLCLGAVGYATLKIWRVATVFDDAPRRAVAFALLLAVLHWGVSVPQDPASAAGHNQPAPLAVMLVLTPTLTLALLLTGTLFTGGFGQGLPRLEPLSVLPSFESPWRLHAATAGLQALWRRPPPGIG
jgi:hypothetical protein